jgi:hypothetical protein
MNIVHTAGLAPSVARRRPLIRLVKITKFARSILEERKKYMFPATDVPNVRRGFPVKIKFRLDEDNPWQITGESSNFPPQ